MFENNVKYCNTAENILYRILILPYFMIEISNHSSSSAAIYICNIEIKFKYES